MSFMKHILFLISACMLSMYAYAQTATVSGKILESTTGEAMIGTIVLLIDKKDTTNIKSTFVDIEGGFVFEKVSKGAYTFRTLLVGYKNTQFELNITSENKDLGIIKLEEDVKTLKEVVISEKIARVEQKGDTTIFNADAYKTNPDATAEDLISKMPGMSVQNGVVKSNGETIKKVTVDGQEFFGEDATLALRNLPSEIIDKVQVFDKQSEQSQFTGFDDGNSQKTINIVTKANKNNGQFGKVYAGYGTDDRYSAGASLNSFKGTQRFSLIGLSNNINLQNFSAQDLTGMGLSSGPGGPPSANSGGGAGSGGGSGGGPGGGGNSAGNFLVGQQSGISTTNSIGLNYSDVWSSKVKISASYFFNNSENNNNTTLNRQYFLKGEASTIYNENNISTTKNNNQRFNARLEYTIDSANSIIYTSRFNYQKKNVYQNLLGTNRYVTDSLLSTTQNNNDNNSDNYSISNNLMFRHKFHKKGRAFSVNLGSVINSNDGTTTLYSMNQYSDDMSNTRVNQQAFNNTNSYTYSTTLSYSEPISKTGVLQFEYSPSYAKNDANKRTTNYSPVTGLYDSTAQYLSNQLDNYILTQKGGIGYRYKKGKTNFMVGGDVQNVQLSSSQIYPSSNQITKTFNNVLPKAMLNIKVSDSSNIRVRYRASTSIPGVNQLQNVIDNSNTILLSAGNQNLKQQYINMLMMNYGRTSPKKATSSMVFMNISQTSNYIANSSYIATKDTVIDNTIVLNTGSQLRRPVNLNGYWNINSFYTYGIPVTKIKSNLNVNGGVAYIRTPGMINFTTNISNAYALNAGLGIASNISKKIDFNITYNASYNIVKNSIQPQLNNNYFYQLSVAKVNVMPYKGLVLSTDLNERLYSGLSSAYDQNYLLWNAAIGYKFLKGQAAEIRLSVFDLLNQNRSISRTVTENYVQDTFTSVLTRYFMLTVSYNIKNFRASGS
ncbi:MAG: outer membrane beta-barrel protein [Cytophagales bacterium]|nr:outer membrane beta-barrel protein [Cytophaga sp.]